jgi:hypothetical protein
LDGEGAQGGSGKEGLEMKYEYYKLHAFVSGGLLTILFALHRLEIIDNAIATVVALPLIAWLGFSIIKAYLSFKDGKDGTGMGKEDNKVLKKISKNKLKAGKKK